MRASTLKQTAGILWGDIHGMAFNQRPLDDYYRYARDVACLDFAAAMLQCAVVAETRQVLHDRSGTTDL